MISGVLFDLDGTLLDCMVPLQKAFFQLAEGLRTPITEESRRKMEENLGDILLSSPSRLSYAKIIWSVGRFLGMPLHKRLLLVPLACYRLRSLTNNCGVFDAVPDVLESLKREGVKMALVTTRSRRDALYILHKFSLEPYFSVVVSRDDVANGKPSPEPLFFAMTRLGLSASEVVMVGDMPTDIVAGKRAGTKTVGMSESIFKRGLLRAEPDALAYSVNEIPRVLAALQVTA